MRKKTKTNSVEVKSLIRFIIFFPVFLFLTFLQGRAQEFSGKLSRYQTLLDSALLFSGDNAPNIQNVLVNVEEGQKEAAAFLIAYMPREDLKTLTCGFILDQIAGAYTAKRDFRWCASLPDTIFFNDVLPYCSLDERRDNWRKDFYERFKPFVENCSTVFEAIDSVNLNISKVLQVDYNTKRSSVNISPFQALEEKMATCTGLSFLLVDALRSVGIPARIAGTPLWTNLRGNHSWVEVWIDGNWYFTEYYPDKLNKSWFVEDAGRADPENPVHRIYAASYKPADTYFPLVWKKGDQSIHACNVTDRYIKLYQEQLSERELREDELIVNVVLYKDSVSAGNPTGRISEKVTALDGDKKADFGFTPGPKDDLNRFLKLRLKKNYNYFFVTESSGREVKKEKIMTSDKDDVIIRLFLD